MDDLNMERQEYEKTLSATLDAMQKMLEQNQQLVSQNQQLTYAFQHPIATHFNEMKEGVQNAIKWCDERLVEIDNKILEYGEKMKEAGKAAKTAVVGGMDAAIGAVTETYQRAIDRLETAKSKIVEFKDNLISKMKDIASKPVTMWKDMISHIKEFTHNGMAKLNETISRSHSENAQAFESKAKRLENFGQDFYGVKCAISDMTRRFFGKPTIEHKPYKPSKFLTKQIDSLLEFAKYEHDQAMKYDFKASAHHIKADMAADDRTFRGMDDKDFGLNDFLDRETQKFESAEPERD